MRPSTHWPSRRSIRAVRFPARASLGVVLVTALLVGCAGRAPLGSPFAGRWRTAGATGKADYSEAAFARKTIPTYKVAVGPDGRPVDTVIGQTREYRVRQGDTLLDVARLYDLGYNEIVAANPGVDPWIPKVGSTIVLPTAWVLPCCTYDGIVLNIPEMRLFLYRRDPGGLTVVTYPVGLGRDDRRTPRGRFRVTTRTVNPTWVIPESIRREHIKERDDPRRVIAGGAPDNPLGKYRLKLDSAAPYGIHGTDIPWGVGMQVSHGCVRLYPEDIERLYPLVPDRHASASSAIRPSRSASGTAPPGSNCPTTSTSRGRGPRTRSSPSCGSGPATTTSTNGW